MEAGQRFQASTVGRLGLAGAGWLALIQSIPSPGSDSQEPGGETFDEGRGVLSWLGYPEPPGMKPHIFTIGLDTLFGPVRGLS